MSSKFSRNIKGGISSIAKWNGGRPEDENEEPQAFGEKLRKDMELATAQLPVQEIEIELLQDNPYQHLTRRSYDDESMGELVDSIKSNGFYGALLARRKPGAITRFELAYGHRRKEAARRAGLKTVPVKIVELNDVEMARIMASENFSRLDLSPLGEAEVLGFLADEQNLSAKEISEFVGKKRGWVEKRLALYHAPQPVKKLVEQKPDTFSHVPLLLRFRNEPDNLERLITDTIAEELTYQQLKEKIDQVHSTRSSGRSNKKKQDAVVTNLTNSSLGGDSDTIHNQSGENGRHQNSEDTHNGVATGVRQAQVKSGKNASRLSNNILSPDVAKERKVRADDIEAQLLGLEESANQVAAHELESLSWNHRLRIQQVSQLLKELVGGD